MLVESILYHLNSWMRCAVLLMRKTSVLENQWSLMKVAMLLKKL